MTKSLKKQLIQYFLIFSLILSSLYILTTLAVFMQTFETYKVNTIEKENLKIIAYIESNFSFEEGYDSDLARNLMMYGQQNAMDLTLYNSMRQQIWSQEYKMGHMGHMGQINRDSLVSTEYPLRKDNQVFGYITIQQSGAGFLSQEDTLFLRTLFIGVILVTVFSFIIAFIIGLHFSRKLSTPIINLKDSTQKIEHGHLSLRIKDQSNITEYHELSNAINDMTATLEKQRTLRTTLANNISHELRTPLYIMKTHIDALSDGIIDPSEETYKSIDSEITHLSQIIADIEQLTDLDDVIELSLEEISLDPFMNTLLNAYEGIVKSDGKHLYYDAPKSLMLTCDPKKLRQVFTNLMSNALKFTDANDSISIKIEETDQWLVIKFRDSGIGIPKDEQTFIFERFYKTAIKSNSQLDGAGLGLSIVKEIVTLHGGNIEVESEKGEYTEFQIKLPLF